MMRTVNEVSKLTGVSVRALHHYDAIGLLKPARVTEAGYRLYDDESLRRLQIILLFRELQFPLKEIKKMLDHPHFDPSEALNRQIELLEMQKNHIGELIRLAREIQENGGIYMDFRAFDTRKMDQYREEAKERWGHTPAYREYEQRRENSATSPSMMDLFAALGALRNLPPDAQAVQEKICELQGFITNHYYSCTDQVFRGLGQMYVQDERFRKNIDQAGGPGTAEFVMQAIEIHCAE